MTITLHRLYWSDKLCFFSFSFLFVNRDNTIVLGRGQKSSYTMSSTQRPQVSEYVEFFRNHFFEIHKIELIELRFLKGDHSENKHETSLNHKELTLLEDRCYLQNLTLNGMFSIQDQPLSPEEKKRTFWSAYKNDWETNIVKISLC